MINCITYKNKMADAVAQCIDVLKDTKYKDRSIEFKEKYTELNNEKKINIVFAGEYSTGKSSIIKALMQRDDIEIDEKPKTSTEKKYDYNGLCIIDTPGLNSGNESHDSIAKEAYKKADVIIFCLSAGNLFTEESKEEFRMLIEEKSVINRIVICINKIDLETDLNPIDYFAKLDETVGEVLDELNTDINNIYKISTKKYLDAFELDLEEEKRNAKIKASGFRSFEDGLNQFSKDNKIMDQKCAVVAKYVSWFIQTIIDEENPIDEEAREKYEETINNYRRKLLDEQKKFKNWCLENRNKYIREITNMKEDEEINKKFRCYAKEFLKEGCEMLKINFAEWKHLFPDDEKKEIDEMIESTKKKANISDYNPGSKREKKRRPIGGLFAKLFSLVKGPAKTMKIPKDKPEIKFWFITIRKAEKAQLNNLQKSAVFITENADLLGAVASSLDVGLDIAGGIYNSVVSKKEQKRRKEIFQQCQSQFSQIHDLLEEIYSYIYASIIEKFNCNNWTKNNENEVVEKLNDIKYQVDKIVGRFKED